MQSSAGMKHGYMPLEVFVVGVCKNRADNNRMRSGRSAGKKYSRGVSSDFDWNYNSGWFYFSERTRTESEGQGQGAEAKGPKASTNFSPFQSDPLVST